MSPKLQLPVPKRGLSDDTANAEQPPLTTKRAKNVRLIDPRSGRSRIASRSGMRKFWTNSKGGRIDHTAVVPYNAPKIEYTQLTETSNGTTDPAALERVWHQPLTAFGRANEVDFQGNLYTFLANGNIEVRNEGGTLLDTISTPFKAMEFNFQALAVDEARRVYATAVQADGAMSRVFQWARLEDEDRPDFTYYDLRWTLDVEGAVQEITAKAGALWLHRNVTTGSSLAHVSKYGALGGTEPPILEWDAVAPYPLRDHAVSNTGEVYVCSPSNTNRGAAPDLGGLTEPVTSWTPHDIGYDAAALDTDLASANRLHAWVDAHFIPGAQDGQFIAGVPDRRYIATQNTSPDGGQAAGSTQAPSEYGQGPYDYTNRSVYSLHATDSTHRIGPQYDVDGIAGLPALYFSGTYDAAGTGYPGMVLRSDLNLGPTFKTDTTGDTSHGTDSDATNVTLATTWTQFTGLSVTVGAPDPGTLTGLVTGILEITGVGVVTVEIRATVDTGGGAVPTGTAVSVEYMQGSHPISVSLPIGGLTAGDYSIQARQIQTTLTNGARFLGATQATVLTVFYQESAPDDDGLAPQQKAIVPGPNGAGGAGDNWTAVSRWRIIDTTRMSMMASQKGNTHQWALLANARIQGGTLGHSPGYVCFISNSITGGDSVQFSIPGLAGNTFDLWRGLSFNANPDGENDNYHVLVTLQLERNQNDDALLKSFFRLNGRAAGRFTCTAVEAWGPSSMVVLGNPHRLNVPHPSDIFPPEVPFAAFDGYFVTWTTLLGSTSADTTANDVATTYPTNGSGGVPTDGDDSGTLDPDGYNTDEPDQGTSYTGMATEVERLEGGVAHDTGMSNFLPNGNTDTTVTMALPYPDHPFGGSALPPVGFAEPVTISDVDRVLHSPRPIFAKLGSNGSGFVWALNGSGLGYGCVALPDGFVATVGEKDSLDAGNTDVVLRRIYDAGQTYSLDTDDGAWTYTDPDAMFADTGFDNPQLVADDAGQVYWPVPQYDRVQKHRGSDGTLLWTYEDPDGLQLRQIALDPKTPLWPEDSDEEDRSPVFFYACGDEVSKVRMVAETQVIGESASPRMFRYIAVSGTTLSSGAPDSMSTNVSGGAFLFDLNRTFISGAQLFTHYYMCDGRSVIDYNPVTNAAEFLDTGKRGDLPKRPRLLAGWLGRLVLARTQDDESTLFASAVGDATDWDRFPVNPSVTDAWDSTLGVGPGSPPDMITALIVLDDILIVGGDHSIYKLVGDPRAGGRIEQVSDETGIAFGKSWCKDPDGLVYFFGSRGGVWQLSRGLDSLVQTRRISEYRIERRLQDVDLSANRVEMDWDYQDEGLRLFIIPYV